MTSEPVKIWVLAHHSEWVFDEATLGLIAEAHRLAAQTGGEARVSAVALGSGPPPKRVVTLGRHGAHELLYLEGKTFEHYRGELFCEALCERLAKDHPSFFLMAESDRTADLAPRIAARLGTVLLNRVVDLKITEKGELLAVRPIFNGYVFEEVLAGCERGPVLVSLLPSILTADEPAMEVEALVRAESWSPRETPGTRLLEVIEADSGSLEIEEADVVVSGGRGMGKGEGFRLISDLAQWIGGTVGGTRPVIDAGILPFDRQIGQTGKSVAPWLIVNCGISGANEYTAGMEKSRLVIAINRDPRARIFQFADLGIVGDVREVLPLLIARLKEIKD